MSITWDLGRAAQNMMLVAWVAGSVPSRPLSMTSRCAGSILGYPVDQHCEYILNFGYPADRNMVERAPRAGGRRQLAEVVREERW